MKKNYVRILTVVMAMLMVLSLVACGKPSEKNVGSRTNDSKVENNQAEGNNENTKSSGKKDKVTIAVVPKALDNAVFLDSKDGAEKAGKELGIEVIWTGPVKADAAEQVQVIEGLIQKKVDGILVSCNDPDALKDVIDKATDVGIKVATFDSDSPDSKRIFYAGTNNYKVGFECGEAMKKLVEGKGKVKTAILTGVPGAYNLEQRIKGFKDGAKGANLEYMPVQACDDDVNKAVTIIEQYTKANKDLGAWFVVGAWPFLTPTESIPVLKDFTKNGGVVVSIDSFYPMLKYVQEDMVHVLVGQDFVAMGELGVKKLYDAVQGKEVPEFVDTGSIYVDDNNVEDVLKITKPW